MKNKRYPEGKSTKSTSSDVYMYNAPVLASVGPGAAPHAVRIEPAAVDNGVEEQVPGGEGFARPS